LLAPDHAALNTPNQIGPADFDGWVQERGAYFPSKWDEAHYAALLGMNDPGEAALRSSLLVARTARDTTFTPASAFSASCPPASPAPTASSPTWSRWENEQPLIPFVIARSAMSNMRPAPAAAPSLTPEPPDELPRRARLPHLARRSIGSSSLCLPRLVVLALTLFTRSTHERPRLARAPRDDLGIAAYGTWRTRHTDNLNTYLKGNSTTTGWGTIGLSVGHAGQRHHVSLAFPVRASKAASPSSRIISACRSR
jgi:hypothetical protein